MRLFLTLVFASIITILSGQSNWQHEVRFGVTYNLHQALKSWKHKFPGYKAFINVNSGRRLENDLYVHHSIVLSIYNKTLGTNLNILEDDTQIDLTNSFTVGYGSGVTETKIMRTIGNSASYNLTHDYNYFGAISSIYILNFSGRNQFIGSLAGTIENFSFSYYNDSGPLIDILPISDNFDRYWTGGFGLFVHDNPLANSFEFSYDQFTGYRPMLYELGSVFGLDIGDYDRESGKNTSASNSSVYNVRFNLGEGFSMNAGFMGSLSFDSKKGIRHFGLQDMIHIATKVALHANRDVNRFFVGFNYDNLIWDK